MRRQVVQECPSCGSSDLEVDHEMEYWSCKKCGRGGGGANFYE